MHKKQLPVFASAACALLLGASFGCGGPQKPVEQPPVTQPPVQQPLPTPDKPPNVTLRLDGISSSKGAHELEPGEVLRSGDRMAVNVGVDQPSYVYVAVASATGSPQFIFPKSGDQQVDGAKPVRIPANPEKWIILDKQVGQEDVFVYASPKPIPSTELTNLVTADAAAAKKAAAKRASKAAPTGPAKTKPAKTKAEDAGALSAGSRGVQIESDDSDEAPPTPGNPNIVVKRFSVIHK